MPHIAIDYSSNVADVIDIDALVASVHSAAMMTGVFVLGSVRTFARPAFTARVGDGTDGNRFVRIEACIAPGRALEVRQAALAAIFGAAEAALKPAFDAGGMALHMELTEFHRAGTLSRNTMLP